MLVDHDILIDAGTGVADLSLAEMAMIDHVFISHSHLDHIAALPLMIDSVADMRDTPLTIYATDATLEILRNHIFNWAIWPDFSEIPSRETAVMQYQAIRLGQATRLDGRSITALPAEHTVPAVGYQLDSGAASLVFTGDTTVNDAFWPVVNRIANLRYLIIETAFANREMRLATMSKHLCPSMLVNELAKLHRPPRGVWRADPEIYITHLKPGQIELTMGEIEECAGDFKPKMLQNNQIFEF
jgi:cAMP phosphodiesterase